MRTHRQQLTAQQRLLRLHWPLLFLAQRHQVPGLLSCPEHPAANNKGGRSGVRRRAVQPGDLRELDHDGDH